MMAQGKCPLRHDRTSAAKGQGADGCAAAFGKIDFLHATHSIIILPETICGLAAADKAEQDRHHNGMGHSRSS
jgi:hypothetical protein